MSSEPTNVEKIRGLPWSIAANASNTFFVQFTFFGSVFVLFLNELGLSRTQMGFLLSLLPFSGLLALVVAPAVARFGYKRTYLTFHGIRKIAAAAMLLTPWIAAQYGMRVTLIYVSVVVGAFSICRAVAVFASYPWIQEYVPNTLRGKYSATNNFFTASAGFIAVLIAGFVLQRVEGLTGFMILIGTGVLFGLVSVWAFTFVPGGAPSRDDDAASASHSDLREALRDRNLLRYLSGEGLVTLATVPLVSFIPLFMQEQVGLAAGNIVLLQGGTLLGGLLSGYLWGWAADRYGSKPVMMSGIVVIVLLPVGWLLMPRFAEWSIYVALGIAFFQGISSLGWTIGSSRLLFVNVVPPEKKSGYMAIYYAWIGIVGGFSQLVGGWILDNSQGLTGEFLIFPIDPYLPLFVGGILLAALSILVFRGVRADSPVRVGEFVGMFFRGNPFLAMTSLIRFHLARDEQATVSMTERLGQTRSPLTVDELLEALADPRFNVRFEAIVSIARMGPDARLIDALVEVLRGDEPALSVIAAWALGRMGDEHALQPLRESLNARYRSVQAHAARSLGTLSDADSLPLLLQRFRQEPDHGLRMAYASALGQLRATGAVGDLLDFLYTTENETARMEITLALARIVGDEHHFIQLLRHTGTDAATTTSQEITALQRKLERSHVADEELLKELEQCANELAHDDLASGVSRMPPVIQRLPKEGCSECCCRILDETARRLEEFGPARFEYVLLSLHTLQVGWQPA
jgi:MFS family permease